MKVATHTSNLAQYKCPMPNAQCPIRYLLFNMLMHQTNYLLISDFHKFVTWLSSLAKPIGRIKIRIQGAQIDVKAFGDFMCKVEAHISALSLVSQSSDYPNRNSTDVRRYLEIEFDSEEIDR